MKVVMEVVMVMVMIEVVMLTMVMLIIEDSGFPGVREKSGNFIL